MKATELTKIPLEKAALNWELMHSGESQAPGDSAFDEIQHRAATTTLLLDEVLHQAERYSYRHWGINE